MDDDLTTFGCSPDEIIELLKIGVDVNTAEEDVLLQKADLLGDRLGEILPVACQANSEVSKSGRQMRTTIAILASEPIGKLLEDPKTDVEIIKMVKEHGKRLSLRSESTGETHVGRVVYYAAIAHALIFHDKKIARFRYENLERYFCQLSEEAWIHRWIIELFTKATEYCKAKAAG